MTVYQRKTMGNVLSLLYLPNEDLGLELRLLSKMSSILLMFKQNFQVRPDGE